MRNVSVCSWSYRKSARGVADEMTKENVTHVQLAVCPFIDPKAVVPGGAGEGTTASGSAVLCPQDLPGEGDAFPAAVFVYLQPKKGTPTEKAAYAVCVRLWWDGTKFVEWTEPE